jgi:predicted transglutaminase-like cysteine proteinase
MTWATKLPATIIATAGTALLLATTSASAARMPLDARRMADLQEVNAHVNATVIEVSDRELYGKDDVWALPVNGKGDCEDFALLKRKLLVERGWPASALKIAAETTPQGEAHAVLAAATDKGTLVLDNRIPSVVPASATGYAFHSTETTGGKWRNLNTGQETSEPTADLPIRR